MTREEFEKRQERAVRETLVIKKTDEGYRVYAPGNPTKNYLVAGSVDAPTCTCPDFENHSEDPDWRCKHILAVSTHPLRPSDTEDPVEREKRLAIQKESRQNEANHTESAAPSQMVLKRSVSPDGRIDSLSVEFSCPVANWPAQEVTSHARKVLGLQSEIVEGFLAKNGAGNGDRRRKASNSDGTVEARLLRVGAMNTKWGRRLFINVQVNGDTLKFFGSRKQLEEAIEAAGFPDRADDLDEGVLLDLPCRVTTAPSEDGRYTNVSEVFPTTVRSIARRSGR